MNWDSAVVIPRSSLGSKYWRWFGAFFGLAFGLFSLVFVFYKLK